MLNKLIIDIKNSNVFDDKGNELGRTGDTKLEIDHEKAMVYMSVNLVMSAANFRRVVDAQTATALKPTERAIRL